MLTDAILGLTLAKSKTLLAGVQEAMVAQQGASPTAAPGRSVPGAAPRAVRRRPCKAALLRAHPVYGAAQRRRLA